MPSDDIIELTHQKVTTVVGFNAQNETIIIGDEARSLVLRNLSNIFNFKPILGESDKLFSAEKRFWCQWPIEGRNLSEYPTRNLSAKDATVWFLRQMLSRVTMPEKIIIGEPAIRDDTWKANFRRHIREVFASLEYHNVEFFPEPFAVFQYYRHREGILSQVGSSENILIIDIGGGTFNSCVIRTTEEGQLGQGGAMALPLGLRAEVCGGAYIDKELLKIVCEKCQKRGKKWKEDPISWVESKQSPALLCIEDAKIDLSLAINQSGLTRVNDDHSQLKVKVLLPKGTLPGDMMIEEELTGEDLKSVVRKTWRKHYGNIIAETLTEAEEVLKRSYRTKLDNIDKVLIAGGSAQLPFMKEEVVTTLPTKVISEDIVYIGHDIEEAVAHGIALECREQSRKDPSLSVGKIASCTNDLFLYFRKANRRGKLQPPIVKHKEKYFLNGQLLSSPFEVGEKKIGFSMELPFEIKGRDRLYFYFTDQPLTDGVEITPLNIGNNDVFELPGKDKLSKKCKLEIEIKGNGMLKPKFVFSKRNTISRENAHEVPCNEFYYSDFEIKEGKAYIGLDFGTSNSYLVKFTSIVKEIISSAYPEYTISNTVKERLRQLELQLLECRKRGFLSKEILRQHALKNSLEVIFHSNKIEGSPLTKGETQSVLSDHKREGLSKRHLEAKNLEASYLWMIEHAEQYKIVPEQFMRELNRMILQDVRSGGGKYRNDRVTLAGTDFLPPMASSISPFMQKLSEEARLCRHDRSILEFATSLHTKLVSIHPFVDGNGRTARLLLNACLIAEGLPIIIVNYSDRERYLDCLKESNDGDLSSMVLLFQEYLEEELKDIESLHISMQVPTVQKEETANVSLTSEPGEKNIIDKALADAGILIEDDPLAAVMTEKIQRVQEVRMANYKAWEQSYIALLNELHATVENFNSNPKYKKAGYRIRVKDYDCLAYEKYENITLGKEVARTWFIGTELFGPTHSQRMMFLFNHASQKLINITGVDKASLIVARYDGTRYQRLDTEPIGLREIGYGEGRLLFLTKDGGLIKNDKSPRYILNQFLADVIRAYL